MSYRGTVLARFFNVPVMDGRWLVDDARRGRMGLVSYDGVPEILGEDLLFYSMVTEGLCAPASIS